MLIFFLPSDALIRHLLSAGSNDSEWPFLGTGLVLPSSETKISHLHCNRCVDGDTQLNSSSRDVLLKVINYKFEGFFFVLELLQQVKKKTQTSFFNLHGTEQNVVFII